MRKHLPGITLWIFFFPLYSFAFIRPGIAISNICFTDSSGLNISPNNIANPHALNAIKKKYASLNDLIQRRTERMLSRMEKKELALQQALQSKDSVKAKELFSGTKAKYDQLNSLLHSRLDLNFQFPLKQYVAGADSTHTALRFLMQNSNTGAAAPKQFQQIQAASHQLQVTEGKLQQADEIKTFVCQREQQLKDQLTRYGLGKQLLAVNKEAFYAQQQLAEYKAIINDKQRLEEQLLSRLNQVPAFADFMQKHSYLNQLFGLPADYGSPTSLVGLQTKDQVQALLARR